MRTSRLLLGALAVVTGLLIGIGGPREVKAVDYTLSGPNNKTSDLTQDVDYRITGNDTTLTIDSNFSSTGKFIFMEGSKLTIKDGGTGGSITFTGNSSGFNGQGKGDLVIESGTLNLSGGGSRTAYMGGTKTITINGGTITGTNNALQSISDFTITGGTINIDATGIQGNGALVSEGGKLEITSGTVIVNGSGRNGISASTVTISGGDVEAKGNIGIISTGSNIGIYDGATVYAEGVNNGVYAKQNLAVMMGRLEAKGNYAIVAVKEINLANGDNSILEPEGGLRGTAFISISGTLTKVAVIKESDKTTNASHVVIDNRTSATYDVTVDFDKSKGTAKADPASEVEEGKTVKLTAAAGEGYEFDKWTSEDGVQFKDATSASTEFVMPGKNVTVTATFKKKGEPTPPDPTPPGPSPEPSKKVVINSKEDLTLDEKFGMEYSLSDENGKNYKNVKFSKFEISGDIPDGLEIVQATNDNGDCYRIKGTPTKAGTYKFTVTIIFTSDEKPDGEELVDNITITVSEKRDRKHYVRPHHDDGDHEDNTPAAVVNPNSIICYYIVNGVIDPKALFGKQEQGPACKASFTASLPKGWTEAFSFSMSYEGANTTTLKNGTLQLYIPGQYQKAGRQYAVMAMDKNGVVHIYQDTDALPFVFTSPINFEGYAFNLIYKD